MELYIGDKNFSFTPEELSYLYHDEGTEATIYRLRSNILKIYKEYCVKERLTEESAEYLTKMKTSRILLPQELIYNENKKFIGYTMPYFTAYSPKYLLKMQVKDFLYELDCIYEDMMFLSEHKVDLEDLQWDNYIYNGKIYIIDPGSYQIVPYDMKQVLLDNQYKMNCFLLQDILISNSSLTRKEQMNLRHHVPLEDCYLGTWMKEEMRSGESVGAYVKRMAKL